MNYLAKSKRKPIRPHYLRDAKAFVFDEPNACQSSATLLKLVGNRNQKIGHLSDERALRGHGDF